MRLDLAHRLHEVGSDVFETIGGSEAGGIPERQVKTQKGLIGTKLLGEQAETGASTNPEQRRPRTLGLDGNDGTRTQTLIGTAKHFRHQLDGRRLEDERERQRV